MTAYEGKVVLASQSPRRRELMGLLFRQFEVQSPQVEETAAPGLAPWKLVEELAARKALAVAAGAAPDTLVVGADTVVAVGGQILGKPHGPEEAAAMLHTLSGRAHMVYTGVCLARGGKKQAFHAGTRVQFKPLSDQEIAWYLSTGEPFDKAGGYGIQGLGSRFVRGIDGDYFNVMGLPVNLIYEKLALLA